MMSRSSCFLWPRVLLIKTEGHFSLSKEGTIFFHNKKIFTALVHFLDNKGVPRFLRVNCPSANHVQTNQNSVGSCKIVLCKTFGCNHRGCLAINETAKKKTEKGKLGHMALKTLQLVEANQTYDVMFSGVFHNIAKDIYS